MQSFIIKLKPNRSANGGADNCLGVKKTSPNGFKIKVNKTSLGPATNVKNNGTIIRTIAGFNGLIKTNQNVTAKVPSPDFGTKTTKYKITNNGTDQPRTLSQIQNLTTSSNVITASVPSMESDTSKENIAKSAESAPCLSSVTSSKSLTSGCSSISETTPNFIVKSTICSSSPIVTSSIKLKNSSSPSSTLLSSSSPNSIPHYTIQVKSPNKGQTIASPTISSTSFLPIKLSDSNNNVAKPSNTPQGLQRPQPIFVRKDLTTDEGLLLKQEEAGSSSDFPLTIINGKKDSQTTASVITTNGNKVMRTFCLTTNKNAANGGNIFNGRKILGRSVKMNLSDLAKSHKINVIGRSSFVPVSIRICTCSFLLHSLFHVLSQFIMQSTYHHFKLYIRYLFQPYYVTLRQNATYDSIK